MMQRKDGIKVEETPPVTAEEKGFLETARELLVNLAKYYASFAASSFVDPSEIAARSSQNDPRLDPNKDKGAPPDHVSEKSTVPEHAKPNEASLEPEASAAEQLSNVWPLLKEIAKSAVLYNPVTVTVVVASKIIKSAITSLKGVLRGGPEDGPLESLEQRPEQQPIVQGSPDPDAQREQSIDGELAQRAAEAALQMGDVQSAKVGTKAVTQATPANDQGKESQRPFS